MTDRRIPEGLSPLELEMLLEVLSNHPSISVTEALRQLKAAGM